MYTFDMQITLLVLIFYSILTDIVYCKQSEVSCTFTIALVSWFGSMPSVFNLMCFDNIAVQRIDVYFDVVRVCSDIFSL